MVPYPFDDGCPVFGCATINRPLYKRQLVLLDDFTPALPNHVAQGKWKNGLIKMTVVSCQIYGRRIPILLQQGKGIYPKISPPVVESKDNAAWRQSTCLESPQCISQ